MSRRQLEMFWMPPETVDWLKTLSSKYDLWFALWSVGFDIRLIEVSELIPEMFCNKTEDTVQIFIGHTSISEKPIWQSVANNRIINFSESYAVQFVPSILVPDRGILLEGRLAILQTNQYIDEYKSQKLAEFFHMLKLSMIKHSDRNRIVTQTLETGQKKQWPKVLIGKTIVKSNSLRLKQFANGHVDFDVEELR